MAEPKVRPLERKSQAETKWRQKMMDNQYSDYFHTLHDETQPVGNLGRGTHYSVLRYASWHDVELKRLDQPVTHDFSVIWDEDHDTRIISAIEKIFEAGLLAPIQFIGERKAFLSIVLAARFRYSGENDLVQRDYIRQLEEISRDIEGDSWNLQIGYYDRTGPFHQTESAGMIACSDAQEDTYLRNIDNLWNLGTWEFHHRYRLRHEIQPLVPEMLPPPTIGEGIDS